MRMSIKPADHANGLEPNIFLNDARAYYNFDKSVGLFSKVTLLPNSVLGQHHPDFWIYRDIEELVRMGYVEKLANGYRVLKAIKGTPSGTAAAVLGYGVVPNGYDEWELAGGQSLKKSGEGKQK